MIIQSLAMDQTRIQKVTVTLLIVVDNWTDLSAKCLIEHTITINLY